MEIKLDSNKKEFYVDEPSDLNSLIRMHYGRLKRGRVILLPEEVLYLMDIRNGKCHDEKGNAYTFNEVPSMFPKRKKLMARYFTYKDWRERGLILRPASEAEENYGRNVKRHYTGRNFEPPMNAIRGRFYSDDLITVVDDKKTGMDLYTYYWIGQHGSYKAHEKGNVSKLDIYETLFLMRHSNLYVDNCTEEEILSEARKRIRHFDDIYSVYEEWRMNGYVVKTGFKFGAHFRIYFPGVSPIQTEKRIHSKHVLHVFPRRSTLITSEWARAIRVAHSVKKTFILAIPGKKSKCRGRITDFALYYRKRDAIDTPENSIPKYLMLSLSEDEKISGGMLSKALSECERYGLDLLIAIADRETSVTYYGVKKVVLPRSRYEYYEIEWVQP